MVVVSLDAVVARAAVVAAWWAPDSAGGAVFDWNFEREGAFCSRRHTCPAVSRKNSEGVISIIGFKGVGVARVDLWV